MVTIGVEQELLRHLADMPFLERLELAAISGWSGRWVFDVTDRMEAAGLLVGVRHGTHQLSATRRFSPTPAGLEILARAEGTTPDQCLIRHPVSYQWQRKLLERLDGVANIYRMVASFVETTGPFTFRWYRGAPIDAGITLSNGNFIAIVRQGPTADRTGFSKRLWRLWQGVRASAVFFTVPDIIRLRHTRARLAGAPTITFVALESEAATGNITNPIWWSNASNEAINTLQALQHIPNNPIIPPMEPPLEPQAPSDTLTYPAEGPAPVHLLSTILTSPEKRALDAIYDWPWISLPSLGALLGIPPNHISELVRGLEDQDLVEHNIVQRRRRLALGDRALRFLARRDRSSYSVMLRRWSVSPVDPMEPLNTRNISGSRSRQLLKEIGHTAAVQNFIGGVAVRGPKHGWGIGQLDPPRRASRFFTHNGRLHSLQPDAFGALHKPGQTWTFFLEWERRAVRPITMATRLAPYLRYYSTRRPAEDNGAVPTVLVVFEDEIPAGQFLGVAREEMSRARVEIPLWVSHKDILLRRGIFGRAWQTPDSLELVSPLP